ncbi:type II toxin-antitoxin system PemK/MazF family toxin [Asticcacaulis sp.]|uniref:type II toxin-antitoxin system PemK/MazF family toxin n=1 Tax=Asticcacaulis sp. TaxID=1872648 RepID=UPI003458DA99
MALSYHPKRGTIVCVDFDKGFREPEMVKRRLCVVLSPPIESRVGLCTVVPLSTSAPNPSQSYHYELDIPFQLPEPWGNITRWVKGDMICAVGFHRMDLLRLGKDANGKRIYQLNRLSGVHMAAISNCVLHSLGLPPLT